MSLVILFKSIVCLVSKAEIVSAFSPGLRLIKLTKTAINDNLLLIEEEHYDKLIELIKQFEQFQFGTKTNPYYFIQ